MYGHIRVGLMCVEPMADVQSSLTAFHFVHEVGSLPWTQSSLGASLTSQLAPGIPSLPSELQANHHVHLAFAWVLVSELQFSHLCGKYLPAGPSHHSLITPILSTKAEKSTGIGYFNSPPNLPLKNQSLLTYFRSHPGWRQGIDKVMACYQRHRTVS